MNSIISMLLLVIGVQLTIGAKIARVIKDKKNVAFELGSDVTDMLWNGQYVVKNNKETDFAVILYGPETNSY